jgi:hypothetical protein
MEEISYSINSFYLDRIGGVINIETVDFDSQETCMRRASEVWYKFV